MKNLNEPVFALRPELSISEKLNARKSIIDVFKDKNLNGWYTFLKERSCNVDPKKVFTVQNIQIIISGKEWGCITTKDEYENYKIVVELKWRDIAGTPRVNKARDIGIFSHSTGNKGFYSDIWMPSIECRLIERDTGDMLVVGDISENFSMTCPVAEIQGSSYVFQSSGKPETIKGGLINWFGRDPPWKDIKVPWYE